MPDGGAAVKENYMKFKGRFKTEYELRTSDNQLICTKPDGKIFYIPVDDIENFFLLNDLIREKQEKIKDLHRIEAQIIKLSK